MRIPRLLHQVPELEASIHLLQHVGVPGRVPPLHHRHVPHGLEDRPSNLCHHRPALLRHQQEQARRQLGLFDPVSELTQRAEGGSQPHKVGDSHQELSTEGKTT